MLCTFVGITAAALLEHGRGPLERGAAVASGFLRPGGRADGWPAGWSAADETKYIPQPGQVVLCTKSNDLPKLIKGGLCTFSDFEGFSCAMYFFVTIVVLSFCVLNQW